MCRANADIEAETLDQPGMVKLIESELDLSAPDMTSDGA